MYIAFRNIASDYINLLLRQQPPKNEIHRTFQKVVVMARISSFCAPYVVLHISWHYSTSCQIFANECCWKYLVVLRFRAFKLLGLLALEEAKPHLSQILAGKN